MSQREYTMKFQLNATKAGSFSSTFQSAQRELAQFQQEYKELSKAQADISAYQKQQAAVEKTEAKLRVLQQQYDNIQREIQETEGFSSALENRLLSKQEQIDRTTQSLQNQTERLDKYGESLHDAGLNTENLTDAGQKLTGQMDVLKQKMADAGERAEEFGKKGQESFETIGSALAAAGIVRGLKEIYEWYCACTDASVAYESDITGVYKTVDGSSTQLAAISDGIKEMSTDIPATTMEISAVAEAAGQLGIATDYVLDFTSVMIDLGESTNLTADEAAAALAKFSNITGTAASDYSRLGSVIVGLGNNFATTEADIVAMSTRLASSGTLAGLTEPEIMALATAMSSVGIEAEAGGTAMTQTLSAIESAVAKGGDDLQKFAEIAGMSAEEFAATWQNQPIMAIQAFIAGLGTLDQKGESAVLVLDELGLSGVRQSNMLKSLGLASNTLSSAIGLANTAWSENVALTEEANKRYATTASQQQMMQNAYNNLRIEIGDNFTPVLQTLYKTASGLFSGVADFVKEYPAVTKIMAALTAGGTAYIGILTALILKNKLAKIATDELNAAMKASPHLMLATGIASVVVALGSLIAISAMSQKETEQLTEASREEYYQLQEVEAEYQRVCEVKGENSEEAEYLAWRIDNLTESYEANKQTLTEYIEENNEAYNSMMSMLDANRDAATEININESTTLALVHRLQELASQTDQTIETQEEMKAIIAELNEVVPELGLNYEDVVGGVTDYATAIETVVRAQAAKQRYEQNQQAMVDALNAQYDAEVRLKEATDQQAVALKRKIAAEAALQAAVNAALKNDPTGRSSGNLTGTEVYKEAEAAREAYATYTAEVDRWQGALDTVTTEYETYLKDLVNYVETTGEASQATGEMQQRTDDLTATMSQLAEAYTEAYNAAYESVSGQYALWDNADKIVATSASSINAALESQIKHWQTYNANLASLGDRATEIEGLNEMLASFADGSAESVNAVAGMAKASNEDLRQMVANWQALQEEQDATAATLAEVKTGITDVANDILQEYTDAIKDMDLSDEAKESATSTLQSFIDAADEMLPQVQAAYTRVGNAALSALGQGSYPHSGNGQSHKEPNGRYEVTPYATGTTYATDAFIAGDDGPELVLGRRGASVFPAQETQRIIDALPNSGNGSGTQITFAPVYRLEGVSSATDLEAVLRDHDEEMREYIRQVVADTGIDAARRSYT